MLFDGVYTHLAAENVPLSPCALFDVVDGFHVAGTTLGLVASGDMDRLICSLLCCKYIHPSLVVHDDEMFCRGVSRPLLDPLDTVALDEDRFR